jgi:hypothetical protein
MADFIEIAVTKTAIRELTSPIADATAFKAIIDAVIQDNPWGCTDYVESNMTVPGIFRNRQAYSQRVLYQDSDGGRAGTVTVKGATIEGTDAATAEIFGDAVVANALVGEPVREAAPATFSCKLRCHDPSGEVYFVTFSRDAVRITSYQDDAILEKVDAWADAVPALA